MNYVIDINSRQEYLLTEDKKKEDDEDEAEMRALEDNFTVVDMSTNTAVLERGGDLRIPSLLPSQVEQI